MSVIAAAEPIDVFRWMATLVLAGAGAFCIVYNARVVLFRKQESWVPLVGGLLVVAALGVLPVSVPWWAYLVPLVADYGCAGGMIHTAIYYLLRRDKSS